MASSKPIIVVLRIPRILGKAPRRIVDRPQSVLHAGIVSACTALDRTRAAGGGGGRLRKGFPGRMPKRSRHTSPPTHSSW